MKSRINTRTLTALALFAAVSSVLMYLEFPLPFFPPFLKFDFSELPVLLAGFLFGPLPGIAVALIKNLLHLFATTTGGVGELANFLVSAALVSAASITYRLNRTKKGAIIGMALGTLSMMVLGVFSNYFIVLPFFASVGWGTEMVVELCRQILPFIQSKWDVVIWGITPFNLFKGVVISLLTLLLYKHLSGVIFPEKKKSE